jgi:hypothetical protein
MSFEGIESKKRRLVVGVFPWLFWSIILMVLVFALMLDEVFLPVCVFWPVSHFLAVQYTIYQLRQMPVAERKLYIAAMKEAREKQKKDKNWE